MGAQASAIRGIAGVIKDAASMVATFGSYQRRMDDWNLQKDLATAELTQLDSQIAAATNRRAMADSEVSMQARQMANAREIGAFLDGKYTNEQLYDWTLTQLTAVHTQAYQLAFALAQQAEAAWQYEVGSQEILRPVRLLGHAAQGPHRRRKPAFRFAPDAGPLPGGELARNRVDQAHLAGPDATHGAGAIAGDGHMQYSPGRSAVRPRPSRATIPQAAFRRADGPLRHRPLQRRERQPDPGLAKVRVQPPISPYMPAKAQDPATAPAFVASPPAPPPASAPVMARTMPACST